MVSLSFLDGSHSRVNGSREEDRGAGQVFSNPNRIARWNHGVFVSNQMSLEPCLGRGRQLSLQHELGTLRESKPFARHV